AGNNEAADQRVRIGLDAGTGGDVQKLLGPGSDLHFDDLVGPAVLTQIGVAADWIKDRAAEKDLAVGKVRIVADIWRGGAVRRSGGDRPRLERQDRDFRREIWPVQTQLVDVAGVGVVVGEINVAIQRIDDGGSQAALARSKRNLSDQGGRHIAILEFYLVDPGADGGVAVVSAVVGVAVNGIDRATVNEGGNGVEIDGA